MRGTVGAGELPERDVIHRADIQRRGFSSRSSDHGDGLSIGRDGNVGRAQPDGRYAESEIVWFRGPLKIPNGGEGQAGGDQHARGECRQRPRFALGTGAGGGCATFRSTPGDPSQLDQQIVRGLPAIVRILGETARHEPIERPWRHRQQRRQRRRIDVHDRRDQARLALAVERLPAGEHFVEHGAEREDVGARVDGLSLHLLRRHVAHGAEDRTRPGQVRLDRLRRPDRLRGRH